MFKPANGSVPRVSTGVEPTGPASTAMEKTAAMDCCPPNPPLPLLCFLSPSCSSGSSHVHLSLSHTRTSCAKHAAPPATGGGRQGALAGGRPEQQQEAAAAGCHGEQELAVDARFPMASRSAALCFSAAATTTTAATGGGRGRSRRRVLVVCCDGGRRSDLLSSSLAAKVLGAPTTFDAAKLTVQHAGAGEGFPRAYTLSHCDFTANLTLAVSETITSEQLRRWGWRRDDVFAEWKEMTCTGGPGGGEMTLHLHCHVSGPNPLQELAAGFRYYVFSKELPLVLKAVVHGDAALFAARPELMDARVWVHFHSSSRKYNRIECWGALRDATKRSLLDGGLVDELQSEITERRRTWNIFNALVSFLL